jgi:hypothetical protein
MLFALSQSVAPVDLPSNFRSSVPEAKMGRSHFFQPFFHSSNSPERESSGLLL